MFHAYKRKGIANYTIMQLTMLELQMNTVNLMIIKWPSLHSTQPRHFNKIIKKRKKQAVSSVACLTDFSIELQEKIKSDNQMVTTLTLRSLADTMMN